MFPCGVTWVGGGGKWCKCVCCWGASRGDGGCDDDGGSRSVELPEVWVWERTALLPTAGGGEGGKCFDDVPPNTATPTTAATTMMKMSGLRSWQQFPPRPPVRFPPGWRRCCGKRMGGMVVGASCAWWRVCRADPKAVFRNRACVRTQQEIESSTRVHS